MTPYHRVKIQERIIRLRDTLYRYRDLENFHGKEGISVEEKMLEKSFGCYLDEIHYLVHYYLEKEGIKDA